jgi:hypothetical protein
MKTTLDLPDDLLIEAKAVAARRRTTLKDMVAHALRREISPCGELPGGVSDRLEVGPFGILRLKKTGSIVTPEMIEKLTAEADEEEFQRHIELRS